MRTIYAYGSRMCCVSIFWGLWTTKPYRCHSLCRRHYATLLVPEWQFSWTELLVAAKIKWKCFDLLARCDIHQHAIMSGVIIADTRKITVDKIITTDTVTQHRDHHHKYSLDCCRFLWNPKRHKIIRTLPYFLTRDRTSTTLAPRATLTRQSCDVTMLRRSKSSSCTFMRIQRLI